MGTTFGWLAGLEIVRSQGDGSLSLEVISVAMVFALLVVSMLVLNDRDRRRALSGRAPRRVGRPEWRLRACQHWGRLPRGCLQKEWAPSDVGRLTIAATRRMAAKATEMMR